MSAIVPVPGRILAVVVGSGPAAAATAGQLHALAIPEAELRVATASSPGEAVNKAAMVDRIDYLVLADAGVEIPDGFLAAAVGALRADASAGLAGWSPTGREPGALELFVPLHLCVVRHSAFHVVGGFLPGLPDLAAVDLGWRLWLGGYRVRSVGVAPTDAVPGPEATAAGPALARLLASVLDDVTLATGPNLPTTDGMVAGRRRLIQRGRRRGDAELLARAHRDLTAWVEREPSARPVLDALEAQVAPDRLGPRRRIAVVTADTLAPRMAGPGIRAREIARRLAGEHEVILATTGRNELDGAGEGFEVRQVGEKGLKDLEQWCDVFVFQGWILAGRAFLLESDKVLVADVYDPMHLEQLEQGHDAPGERGRFDAVRGAGQVLNQQLGRADFAICASAKQRDLWLGQLAALGRINPVTYDGDESLDRLLAVVPFGVGDEPPVRTRSAIRGTIPGIGPDDKVILWGGGVYNWFDPLTLIRAVDALRHRVPDVRLFFLGLRHPNPDIPQMRMAVETKALAEELGLAGTHVFFNEDWVAFDDRQNYLLDADVGVSTHLHHIETEFSFRTRILDYLWAGLPILATDGDSFAEVIRREGLGVVVPPSEVEPVVDGLERLLTDAAFAAECRANVARLAEGLTWTDCLAPLVEFCRDALRAADIACLDVDPHAEVAPVTRGRRHDLEVAWAYLRAGGPKLVADKAMVRIRRNRT